jgi:NAD(P)-dependent dehydrogenase (short-subunit alcohol dehydrogenase family)
MTQLNSTLDKPVDDLVRQGRLKGKVAVITGGNSGIGLATARRFIAEGAKVVITGRRAAAVEQAVQELGAEASGVVGDVGRLEDLDLVFDQIAKLHGKIDILFANAGIGEFRHLSEVDEAFYDKIMDINTKGLFFTVQKALPLLRDGASILLNASAVHHKGFPNFSVYAASKAAVRSFARSWATDLKERGIRVNVISPGPIQTPIIHKLGLPEAAVEDFSSGLAQQVPLGRVGLDDEIANTAVFLASDESSFINGADISVDGGLGQV